VQARCQRAEAAFVEVLGVAVGVVLEGGGDGCSGGVAYALALPHQPPEEHSPLTPAAAVVAGEQLEPCRTAAHARRQPRGGGHAAREVGVSRLEWLALHVHCHDRARWRARAGVCVEAGEVEVVSWSLFIEFRVRAESERERMGGRVCYANCY
jgi:hypothetical protein